MPNKVMSVRYLDALKLADFEARKAHFHQQYVCQSPDRTKVVIIFFDNCFLVCLISLNASIRSN